MAQWGHALAAAVSGGLAGYRMAGDEKDRAEDREFRTEQRAAQREQLQQQRQLRAGLADAVRPATVAEVQPITQNDDDGNPMPAPGLWQVENQRFTSPADADAAVRAHNAPEAQTERMGLAYTRAGMPEKAINLADAQLGMKVKRATLADNEQARARESMFRDVTTQFARGGWQSIPEIYKGYNDGNSARVEEDGKGGATVVQVGADGKELGRRAFASPMDFLGGHVAALDPKLWVGMENQRSTLARQIARDEQTQRNQDRTYALQVQREERMESRADQREARTTAAAGVPSREERLRYTSLFSEAGRRMSDTQRALGALRKDPLYAMAKPGTPQHQEMQELRDTITQLGEERKTYQSMLAGSQTDGGGAGTAGAPPAPRGAGGPVRPGARLPTDTDQKISDARAIMEGELQTARARGDTETVAAVEREIARLPAVAGSQPASTRSASAPAPAAASAPRTAPPPPKAGTVQSGFRFKGGNPADKSNWERV